MENGRSTVLRERAWRRRSITCHRRCAPSSRCVRTPASFRQGFRPLEWFSELFKNRMGLLEVGDQRIICFRDSLENDGPDGAIVHLPATINAHWGTRPDQDTPNSGLASQKISVCRQAG